MSNTPRTDAAVKQYDGSWFAHEGPAYDLLELCRELERELIAVNEECSRMTKACHRWGDAVAAIETILENA